MHIGGCVVGSTRHLRPYRWVCRRIHKESTALYGVFSWRGRRVRVNLFRDCLVGGWESWVGFRVGYSSQMQVGLVYQNLADGAPAGLMFTKHWIPSTKHWTEPLRPQSFNQTLKRVGSVPKIEVLPNTLLSWLRPKNWVRSNPTHPTPNQTHGLVSKKFQDVSSYQIFNTCIKH